VVALKLNLDTARERLHREEERAEQLRLEDEYKRRLMAISNQVINGSQKLVFLAVREYIFSLWDRGNALGQFVHVPFWELAKTTGLSTDVVGSSIQRLHKVGLVVRDERPDREKAVKGGPPQTQVLVALTLLSYSLELAVETTSKRNHGGERQRCKFDDCRSDKLVKRTVVVCQSCWRQQGEPEETPVNPPDPMEEALVEAEKSQRQARERAASAKAARSLDVEELDDELASLSAGDAPEAAVVPDLDQVESLEEERETVKQQDGDTVSSSGPQVAARSDVPLWQQEKVKREHLQKLVCAICMRDRNKRVISWFWSDEHEDYKCTACGSLASLSEGAAAECTDEAISGPILSEQSSELQVEGRSSAESDTRTLGYQSLRWGEGRPPKPEEDCALCWRDRGEYVRSWVWSKDGGEAGGPGYICLYCLSAHAASLREIERQQREGGIFQREQFVELGDVHCPYSLVEVKKVLLEQAEQVGYPALKWRDQHGTIYRLDAGEDAYLGRVAMGDKLWMWMAVQMLESLYGEEKVQVQE